MPAEEACDAKRKATRQLLPEQAVVVIHGIGEQNSDGHAEGFPCARPGKPTRNHR